MRRFPSVDGTVGFWIGFPQIGCTTGQTGALLPFKFFFGVSVRRGGGQVVVDVRHLIGVDKCLRRMEQR